MSCSYSNTHHEFIWQLKFTQQYFHSRCLLALFLRYGHWNKFSLWSENSSSIIQFYNIVTICSFLFSLFSKCKLFFIGDLIYLHFLLSPFPLFPPANSLSHPLFYEGTPKQEIHPSTYSHITALAFLHTGAPSLYSGRSPLPLMTDKATYAAESPVGPSMCTLWWWFSPWELWGIWLVNILVLSMGWETPSAPSVLPVTSPLCSHVQSYVWLWPWTSVLMRLWQSLSGDSHARLPSTSASWLQK